MQQGLETTFSSRDSFRHFSNSRRFTMNHMDHALRIYEGVVAATIDRARYPPFASVSIVGVSFSWLAPPAIKLYKRKSQLEFKKNAPCSAPQYLKISAR
jgi:hypothetical protein